MRLVLAALVAAVVATSAQAGSGAIRTGADLFMSCGKDGAYQDRAPCIYWLDRALSRLDWPSRAFAPNGSQRECPKTESAQDFATWTPRMIAAFRAYWSDPATAGRLVNLSQWDAAIEALARSYPECSQVGSS